MDSPDFSIVTVTLNSGEQLGRTIASLATQTYRKFEHIVKDGGSTDGSLACCQPWDGRYALHVVTERDTGIYDAMNQALAHCRGRYVLFLNAGDCLATPDVLTQLAPAATDADAPGVLYTDYAMFGEPQRITSPVITPMMLYWAVLCHQACYIRRDYYEQYGGFDTSLKVLADHEMLLRVKLRARATHRYVPIVSAECLGGGFSTTPRARLCAQQEIAVLRRRHFSPAQRLSYGLPYALTLPGVRIRLMQSPKMHWLRPFYTSTVNWIHRRLNPPRISAR